MQRLNFIFCLVLLPGIYSFFSCRSKAPVKEIKRDGLAIAFARIPPEPGATASVNYSARLTPDKKLTDKKEKELSKAMWYRMDSCFYLQRGAKKIYASITQPIANGVAGSYEYFLSFDMDGPQESGWNLIYEDKYLNRKKYSLNTADL